LWPGYGSIEHGGIRYGQRVHSMRKLISLPRLTRTDFELALAIHGDEEPDLQALARNGWKLADPVEAHLLERVGASGLGEGREAWDGWTS
jgi:hypothetical protein